MKRMLAVVVCWLIILGSGAAKTSLFHAVPLVDMTASARYLGQFAGQLYDGSNEPPADYLAFAQAITDGIVPLDQHGNPSVSGQIPFLAVGMSNTRDFWCAAHVTETMLSCENNSQQPHPSSLMGQAAASPDVNHTTLRILNGAQGARDAQYWVCAVGPCGPQPRGLVNQYDRVRDEILTPNGFTELQIQAVWLLQMNMANSYMLPDGRATAYRLEGQFGAILRALRTRYPNLRLVVISALNYTGYAGTATVQGGSYGPEEAFSYESGFSVKWLVAAKIQRWRTGTIDPIAGDLSAVPVIYWSVATYLWGSGTTNPSNSLALSWARTDLQAEGIHPTIAGTQQAAARLLAGFLASPLMRWFRA